MTTDPTAEHIDNGETQRANIDTITAVIGRRGFIRGGFAPRDSALDILTSTDPAVHAALAASLPAEVMLAALVDRLGHDEWRLRFSSGSASASTEDFAELARWMQRGDVVESRRALPAHETPWEVAP